MVSVPEHSRRERRKRESGSKEGEEEMDTDQTSSKEHAASARGDLEGRVALVTGGSGGIGRALVRTLAAQGVAVAIGYGTQSEAAEQLAAEMIAAGGRAIAVGADLRRSDAPGALVDAVEAALGPVDILVSNAGMGRIQTFEEVTSDDFDEALAINLRAPHQAMRAIAYGSRPNGMSSAAVGGVQRKSDGPSGRCRTLSLKTRCIGTS